VYLPILVLVIFSFNAGNNPHSWTGFSLTWYKKAFTSIDMLAALQNSLIIAFASTFISIFFGASLIIASKWWRPRWMFSVFLPSVVTPEIVIAVGLLSLFYLLKIPVGFNSLIAGHSIIGLGFAVPILRTKFARLDPVLTEASQDLGANYWQTFYKVLLPLLTPSIIAAAFVVFTISLDDFFISFFCAGAGQLTIATYVYAQVRAIPDPSLNALSSFLLFFSCAMILILSMTKISKEIISDD
jgi:spermidine/putrescine transport system permease protein